MEPKERKSIAILAETHRAISFESVRTGKGMYELMAEAWTLYERYRDHPAAADKVVAMPPLAKRDSNTTMIAVPPEIARDVQRIVDVLRAPGAMEQFDLLMRAIAKDTMGELAKSFTSQASEKKRK